MKEKNVFILNIFNINTLVVNYSMENIYPFFIAKQKYGEKKAERDLLINEHCYWKN